MKRHLAIIFLLVTVFMCQTRVLAGTWFELLTTSQINGVSYQTNLVIEDSEMSMTLPNPLGLTSGGEAYFQADLREMIIVDHASKNFIRINDAVLASLEAQFQALTTGSDTEAISTMNIAMKEAYEKALAELENQEMDDEARQAAQKALRDAFGISEELVEDSGLVELQKTSVQETFQNYPVVRYDLFEDGQRVEEFWVTDWANITEGNEAKTTFYAMLEFLSFYAQTISSKGGETDNLTFFNKMQEMDGFVVLGQSFQGEQIVKKYELINVYQEDVPEYYFTKSWQGYKERSLLP